MDAVIRALPRAERTCTSRARSPADLPGFVADDLATLQREAALTREQVAQLVRNAFTIGWLDDAERGSYPRRLDDRVASH